MTVTNRQVTAPEGEACDCGIDYPGETHRCIEGWVYGPCSWADCGGVCVTDYQCGCPCHDLREPPLDGVVVAVDGKETASVPVQLELSGGEA